MVEIYEPPACRVCGDRAQRNGYCYDCEPIKMEFQECESCAGKPGSPDLCAGCLHNRRVIERAVGFMLRLAIYGPGAA